MSNHEQHQSILGFMYMYLSYVLEGRQKSGRIYLKGLPMFIETGQPIYEPDLMIVFEDNYERIEFERLRGPADIIIEITSPTTNAIDRGEKFDFYEAIGVPEYWIIDPIRQTILVHILDHKQHYQLRPVVDTSYGNKVQIGSDLLGIRLHKDVLWMDKLPTGSQIQKLYEQSRRGY